MIEKAIERGLKNNLFDLILDLIHLSEGISEHDYKKILMKFINESRYDLLLEILNTQREIPIVFQIFSELLFEKYLENKFNNNFYSSDLDEFANILLEKQIEGNNKFKENIKIIKTILEIIEKDRSLGDTLRDIIGVFLTNEALIDLKKINLSINAIYRNSNGFSSKFFSLYDLFKFTIINLSKQKEKHIAIFKEAETQFFDILFIEFSEILNKLSEKYKEFSEEKKKKLSFDEFLRENFLKYFSYYGCNFYKGVLIKTIIRIRREIENEEQKDGLISFYLRFSNNYWNYILKKMYSDKSELTYFSEWDDSLKRKYKLYVVEQILLLRCRILYKAVDFRVLNKIESYNKVLNIITNAREFFRSNNYTFILDNKNFIEEILIKTGWNRFNNQRKI
ncbi:MAG: hypothetical protein GF329_02940 [Candidatus Lokiarchaeota archaeon]|nr:hypothetical protein [Candidatus Lokiarchaeota archaeon]